MGGVIYAGQASQNKKVFMVTRAFSWNKYCTYWGFLNLEIRNAEGLSQCILEQFSVVLNGNSNKLIT
jgi:hypothetical protein